MLGNVEEWCQNKYEADSNSRVLRGGSFYYGADDCRSAFRNYWLPGNRYNFNGFRVSRTYR